MHAALSFKLSCLGFCDLHYDNVIKMSQTFAVCMHGAKVIEQTLINALLIRASETITNFAKYSRCNASVAPVLHILQSWLKSLHHQFRCNVFSTKFTGMIR